MRKKTVLVIDDDDMNLQIAKMILERKLPCKVITVDNGRDGVEILRSERVNLVLLDILMPDFDGIETLQEIRGDERIKAVPVMMLTATGEPELVRKAGALGVTDYIKKPFLPADLVQRVEKKLAEEHSESVLIFGDDVATLERMKNFVEENFPNDVIIAATYDDAIKNLRGGDVTLVIACANMKFIDGFKLLKFMADDETFGGIPFALTTPERLGDLLDKLNAPEEIPEVEVVAQIVAEEIPESVTAPAAKKKIANVVTNFIGYELDTRI